MSAHAARTPCEPKLHAGECPNCGNSSISTIFYEAKNVPVHSVLLMPTRECAVQFRRGDIELGLCEGCGFVTNTAFDPHVHSYSERYEETQGFSPTFQQFHRRLAESLIDTYGIRGKRVVEIGCGKGEFLSLLCDLGENIGIGFDPAFVPERNPAVNASRVTFIQDFYSEAYSDVAADVICCKMTLEHIYDTRQFLETVRRSIGGRSETLVFFQVPDFERVLRDVAFWDIYYEHCSYFDASSLRNLFELCGFEVIDSATEYDGQYLQIFARPARVRRLPVRQPGIESMRAAVQRFGEHTRKKISIWDNLFAVTSNSGQRCLLWGSGSKAVSFLSALENPGAVEHVVDINPYRHGHYMPGTGHQIVAPEFLTGSDDRTLVVAMNAIYLGEIQKTLDRINSKARLLSV